ncbi:hypothetical protein GIW70_02865 [Pseudomonas syringae]|nr:hypothetical protein [Pseudomonas syringae]MCF5067138.1 hypothetical protein [Pseudomonas syringae]
MFKFSKLSSLTLVAVLFGGLGMANLASANAQLVAEYGSQALQKDRIAEGGADRLQQAHERVAEGGADRLQDLRERVAEGGSDRLQELRERVALSAPAQNVLVAENRAEFGSKYQRY